MLNESGLLRIVRLLGDIAPQDLIRTLLNEIGERYPDNLAEDDVTMLVVQANGSQTQHSLADKLRAGLRLVGHVLRAVNPKAERPSLPEANLANLGGAIIPALSKRWRTGN